MLQEKVNLFIVQINLLYLSMLPIAERKYYWYKQERYRVKICKLKRTYKGFISDGFYLITRLPKRLYMSNKNYIV